MGIQNESYKKLGNRLQIARERVNLSQQEAANLLGKPQWFVSRSETGARRVDVIELVEFSRIYRVNLDFFLHVLIDRGE